MRRIVVSTLLTLPLLATSCVAVLGIGAGVIISQDMMDRNTYVAQVQEDVDIVWAVTKASLSGQATNPIRVNEDVRGAIAVIDNAEVTVSVEAYDLNRCRLIVSAEKFGVSNGEIAEIVFNRILNNFNN